MTLKNITSLALFLLVCWGWHGSLAQQPARIGELTDLDRQFMTQQRETLQDLAMTNLGRQFNGDRSRDLELLQTLLDKQLVRSDQVRELQAMGVIMGDLLAVELDMHWIVYEDDMGRSRALRRNENEAVLFPVTMIARRREAGNETSVVEIYKKASDVIIKSAPALPYQ